MPNRYRGEVEAELDGVRYTLCLTLGALAELETAFEDDDMLALASRFERGRLSASECVRIIGAGLRGAGHDITDDMVATMHTTNGVAGFVDIVARLLKASFELPSTAPLPSSAKPSDASSEEGRTTARPFPGST